MSYNVLLGEQPQGYIEALDEKSERIVKDNLSKLADDPHPRPGSDAGDREQLTIDGEELYRLHIGRTHSGFYEILESQDEVRVVEILSIDEAHDRYGQL